MAVRVRVLYFGTAREAVGRREEELYLDGAPSVGDLVALSLRSHAALRAIASSMRLAVNEELAGEDERLADGDVVAFLPPVAGG